MANGNKEIKLDLNVNARVKYGTTNSFNPQVIYINAKSWLHKDVDKDKTDIIPIEKKFKYKIRTILSQWDKFDRDFILDFDFSKSNKMKKSNKLFLEINLFIRQRELYDLCFLKDDIKDKVESMIKYLEKELNDIDIEMVKSKTW